MAENVSENVSDNGSSEARPPLGSVAEETARLLDALLSGAGGSGHDEASGAAYRTDPADPSQPATAEACPTCGHVPGPDQTVTDGDVCRLCPVCQLLRVVRTVRPETLDRMADLAAAVTETLRDVAASRWHESGSSPPRRTRPEVEDIQVEGEESR